jgi:hypothetical protein
MPGCYRPNCLTSGKANTNNFPIAVIVPAAFRLRWTSRRQCLNRKTENIICLVSGNLESWKPGKWSEIVSICDFCSGLDWSGVLHHHVQIISVPPSVTRTCFRRQCIGNISKTVQPIDVYWEIITYFGFNVILHFVARVFCCIILTIKYPWWQEYELQCAQNWWQSFYILLYYLHKESSRLAEWCLRYCQYKVSWNWYVWRTDGHI